MSTAIVAGPAVQIDAVAAQLQACGFDTVVVDADRTGGAATVDLRPDSVDCYLHVAPSPGEAAAAGPDRMIGSLVAGIGQLAGARSLLRPGASAVILAEGWDPGVLEAVRVLTRAALPHGAGINVQVVDGLAAAVESFSSHWADTPSADSLSLLADVAPEMGFTDWRDEIMSATSSPARSYLGWTTVDGRRRAAVLSGAVISPLAESRDGSPELSWGEDPGPGVAILAEAILADALRAREATRPGAPQSPLAAELSDAFAKETVMHLPLDGFELSAAEVMGWARRHLYGDQPGFVTPAVA